MRSYFRDERTLLLDMKDALKSVSKSLALFNVFNSLIGVIALTLAFFLLLISTT